MTAYQVAKGAKFTLQPKRLASDLTLDMLTSGEWRDLEFKDQSFDYLGVRPNGGHLHPLLKVRAEYRQIFLEMVRWRALARCLTAPTGIQ